MIFVRRHLRRGVVAWLLCHALTFTALLPRDCCAAHAHAAVTATSHAEHGAASAAPAADDAPPCHETAAATPAPAPADGDHCAMAAHDGAACPMHRPGAAAAPCAMSGGCHAPESALAAVVLQSAVLVHTTQPVPLPAVASVLRPPDVSARSLATPPDAPPPRA